MNQPKGHRPRVCVVGSVNMDLIVHCPRLPQAGETVTGGVFSRAPGGKGANQALAAQRHNSDVVMFGAVGADSLADEALAGLAEEGVDLSRVVRASDVATGVALIAVAADGENQIAVAPGANLVLGPADVEVGGFDAVLCQLEIRDETIAEAALQAEGLFCLNAAPARDVGEAILSRTDVLIVNETEHAFLQDRLDEFSGVLVVTKGAQGAVAYRNSELIASALPPPVEAVDTVGAGDAFCGALVADLARGLSLEEALTQACAAGAEAATRPGAQ